MKITKQNPASLQVFPNLFFLLADILGSVLEFSPNVLPNLFCIKYPQCTKVEDSPKTIHSHKFTGSDWEFRTFCHNVMILRIKIFHR
jgi:hypothetical protein